MSWGRRYSDPFAFGRHVGSLRSRRWGRYPEKTYEDYRREEAEERQRKINAVLSEIREKFGEGVMRLGSDFLKDEELRNDTAI